MRIRELEIDNFKSLVDFKLDLAKFTCLIGLNGAGKSTVLQCIDFLSQQVRGDIKGWLAERSWKSADLKSRLILKKNNIDFKLDFVDGKDRPFGSWVATFNTSKLYCTFEQLSIGAWELDVRDGTYAIRDDSVKNAISRGPRIHVVGGPQRSEKRTPINFTYEGSILSQLKDARLGKHVEQFKGFLQNTRSLDLLSPELLRQRTRESVGSLGLGGRRLSSYLHELDSEKRGVLLDQLQRAYKRLANLQVKSLRSGWKQLEIEETFDTKKLTTEARHINDGMLRLTAMLAELCSDHEFLLFDEIENGVNPELVEFVINALTSARQQVLVTTHSPMILNYLTDDVARSGVMYLYKTSAGSTQSIPFFSIPSLAKKLTVMGPGEAFVDTNLTLLSDEIEQLKEGR